MRLKLIFFITMTYINIYSQSDNQDYNLSKEKETFEFINKLKNDIQSNNVKSIYDFADKDFKLKYSLDDLKKRVNTINNILKKYNVRNLNSISHSTNSYTYFNKENKTESFYSDYKLIPKYFNSKIKMLFSKPLGFYIKLEVSKRKNEWFISDLVLKNEYTIIKESINTKIIDFFKDTDSLNFKYSINNYKKERLLYENNDKQTLIKEILIKEFQNSEYIDFSDLEKENIFNQLHQIYSLSLSYENKLTLNDIINKKKKKRKNNLLEIAFYNSKFSNLILVSNGEDYAFYKVKSLKKIKNFISDKIIKITK